MTDPLVAARGDKNMSCEDADRCSNWQYQAFCMLIWAIGLPIFVFACLYPAAQPVQHALLWISLTVSGVGLFGAFLAPSY